MKIISDYTTQTFSKPYNFRVTVYKEEEDENEYMSITANVKNGERVCEFNIPKIDLSELILNKKSYDFNCTMNMVVDVIPVIHEDERTYLTFIDLDFGK